MNTTTQASRFIPITNPDLRFMGRIDRTPADHQTWAFPYTQVSFRCTGTSIGVRLVNHWGYGDAYLGAIIDGMQVKARVPIDGAHDGISMENGFQAAWNRPDSRTTDRAFRSTWQSPPICRTSNMK